jgi:hypothetical protein
MDQSHDQSQFYEVWTLSFCAENRRSCFQIALHPAFKEDNCKMALTKAIVTAKQTFAFQFS